jgi:hypothetical protein
MGSTRRITGIDPSTRRERRKERYAEDEGRPLVSVVVESRRRENISGVEGRKGGNAKQDGSQDVEVARQHNRAETYHLILVPGWAHVVDSTEDGW